MTTKPVQLRLPFFARALLWFWAAILATCGLMAIVLQILGPPVADGMRGMATRTAGQDLPPLRIALPNPALLESGPYGAVPRIAEDGRMARNIYARPLTANAARPRIAVIVAGIGLSESQTHEALRKLPFDVTLSVSPYANDPMRIARAAQQEGFETLAGIPMEPAGYPMNDAGPRSLLLTSTEAENNDRLMWALSRMQAYPGVTAAIGGSLRGDRFSADQAQFTRFLAEIRRRGLFYLDPSPGAPVPPNGVSRSVDLLLDDPSALDAQFQRLEDIAYQKGSAIGLIGMPQPVVMDRLVAWASRLPDRGLVLAPVSALMPAPTTGR